jgi:DNA-binding PadR family transcriptional regulator
MYKDNSLLPREAVRLAALGTLAGTPMSYSELAAEVRDFTSHIAGPSLDLMGTSIELLRYEGLVKDSETPEEEGPQALLVLTDEGRAELHELLLTGIRPPINDVTKLIIALKFRFMHLLEREDQRDQVAIMIEACEIELARLKQLRDTHSDEQGGLLEWLEHDSGLIETRLVWLRDFMDRLL